MGGVTAGGVEDLAFCCVVAGLAPWFIVWAGGGEEGRVRERKEEGRERVRKEKEGGRKEKNMCSTGQKGL